MITKGSAEYKKAQEIANKLQDVAKTERWNSHEYFELFAPIFEDAMNEVKKTNGFASQVAESVAKTIDYYGFKIASISSKQAWIIACAIVENDIKLEYFNKK